LSLASFVLWLDSDYFPDGAETVRKLEPRYETGRFLPFVFIHLGCLAVAWVGASPIAVATAVLLYLVRMFAITGFYHRYFSHRTFKTTRLAQFCFAVLGASSMQRGPLWWAAHHRSHHTYADEAGDSHSPRRGFFWSHMGWLMTSCNMPTRYELVHDFAQFPELRLLNRFDWSVPALLFAFLYIFGQSAGSAFPQLHTSGGQMVVWGFFISTVVLLHATFAINSVAHIYGSRRYDTADDSKNNFLLALVTLGEGWHNNHHKCCSTVRQGFYWWEIDITYYCLLALSWIGVISDLRPPPATVYEKLPGRLNHQVPLAATPRENRARVGAVVPTVIGTTTLDPDHSRL
jgi:stearoyl-CoA desaturase (delta-9 desaturase)